MLASDQICGFSFHYIILLHACRCCLTQAYTSGDGLACHNLIMLLAYCYSAGLVAADCMYRWGDKQLAEI